MKQFILILLFSISCSLFAHDHQLQYDSLVEVHFSAAKQLMDKKDYNGAHNEFKELFKLQSTIPDDAAYYYGLNQYYRKNYKLAQQGFEKYMKLRGEKGQYFDSSFFLSGKIPVHGKRICRRKTGMQFMPRHFPFKSQMHQVQGCR